jgi:hypothetical protein
MVVWLKKRPVVVESGLGMSLLAGQERGMAIAVEHTLYHRKINTGVYMRPIPIQSTGMTGTRRWESYLPPVWIICSPLFTVAVCSFVCLSLG